MEEIRKIYYTVCINKKEYKETSMGKVAFALKMIELRKQYPNAYIAVKNVTESDTTTMGNTHIIRRAA